jgi:hypothetical protein
MDPSPQPRADLVASALWLALGLLTLQQSWTMDRLEAQGADPWSAPGVVPGIIGAVITLLGLLLLVRSLRQPRPVVGASDERAEVASGRRRLLTALGLCLLFVFGLLGRGLPSPPPTASSWVPPSTSCSRSCSWSGCPDA